MAPKSDDWRDFPMTSGDEWLERKRNLDGAEGLWRIRDKLYDFTLWSRAHPGGKFWIDVTRGIDVTEVFESHHLSEEPESLLKKFYLREAGTPTRSAARFEEKGFLGVFKKKVRQMKSTSTGWKVLLLTDGLVGAVFLSGFLGAKYGHIWPLVSGVLLGTLAISMHGFLHMKDNWRVYYFNISLMSSREWRIRHVLSHHHYRGTCWDLETSTWKAFDKLFPANKNFLAKCLRRVLGLLMFATSAHIQFFKRFLDVFLSRKLSFEAEELFGMFLPAFMLMFSGPNLWNSFVVWNFIILVGSFVFSLFKSIRIPSASQLSRNSSVRGKEDFGITQLSLTGSHPKENLSVLSILNSCRTNAIHYLCPTVSCRRLSQLIPAFEACCAEFGVSYDKSEPLGGLSDGSPRGHVFFS